MGPGSLRSWFSRQTGGKRSRAPGSARLTVERLEARDVPTLVIAPHFEGVAVNRFDLQGKEQLVHKNNTYLDQRYAPHVALTTPKIFILFTNNARWFWEDHKEDESNALAAAQRIISGDYLNGLVQYGYKENSATLGNPD